MNNKPCPQRIVRCAATLAVVLAAAIAPAETPQTAEDLAIDVPTATWYTEDPLHMRLWALTRDYGVSLDAIVAKPAEESPGPRKTPFEVRVTGEPVDLETVIAFLILEPDLSIASLTLTAPDPAESQIRFLATLDLWAHVEEDPTQTDPAVSHRSLDLFKRSLELLVQEEISELRIALGGADATLFLRDGNGEQLTDAPMPADELLREMLQPAPERRQAPDLEFETATGSKVRLSSLRGSVVLIEFWASWCLPCIDGVRQLKALELELGAADFQVVGVSLSENRESFVAFLAEHRVPWPQLHEDGSWSSPAARAFRVSGLPAHFLVDRDGLYTRLQPESPEQIADAVRALLDD